MGANDDKDRIIYDTIRGRPVEWGRCRGNSESKTVKAHIVVA